MNPISIMNIRRLPTLLFVSIFLVSGMIFSQPLQAKTIYVSDELKVPLRSGASSQHRILKFIRSGTSLKVLGASDDDKYIEVETGGKTGWVLAADTMTVPSGRDRLVAANKKLDKVRAENKELKSTISTLRADIKALKGEKSSLQNERTNLSNSLEDMKITAANPLALSKKNKELKKELEKVRANEDMLENDNQQLRSNVTQEWFIIGGGVSIGSLILGIILTRINWRRKRDSWGDSF